MTITLTRRHFVVAAVLALSVLAGVVLARQALTGLVVNALLSASGASEISFTITAATPWRVVVEDIGFQVRTQAFTARRVTVTRAHWWSPSLGILRVEQARLPLALDGMNRESPPAAAKTGVPAGGTPVQVPFEEVSVDGELVIQAAALPEQVLTLKITAKQTALKTWTAQASANSPGFGARAEGTFDPATAAVAFKLPAVTVDVKVWQGFVQKLLDVTLPEAWELEGKLSGSAEGRLVGDRLEATARVQLREGRAVNAAEAMSAEGIEADVEFTDLDRFQSRPGTVRVRELRTGRVVLRELEAEFASDTAKEINVTRATLKALGGGVALEPFKYFPDRQELDAVVLVDGISVEELMALTQDLPAKATGRVNGRFPLHLDEGGMRIGTGWLELKPGVAAEIQFNATGLLTRGVAASNPSYAVLKKVETGLLKLAISELRLDIRPPNAPPGRSATLHIAGRPADPEVKAPVTLDLNVNGPLEKLLNMGLDSRLSFGTKP